MITFAGYMRRNLTMQKIIIDKELGKITLKKYRNSTKYTIRIGYGEIRVSLPASGSFRFAREFIETHREDLVLRQQKISPSSPVSQEETKELYRKARLFLPQRLEMLAKENGFIYSRLRIGNSKTRWGSCSGKKNICLSVFLMRLPVHLIDYVLFHELCHTVEMNHGKQFWELLDRYCKGRAKELRKELSNFK